MTPDIWLPLALTTAIETGTSAGTAIDGTEIAVWRDVAGRVHTWEDRCPHRGMKLSFGFVRGDHIACLYHGWQYDAAGQCRYIPAHPDLEVPKSICVKTWPVAEAGGMVWVWLGAGALVPAPDLPQAVALRSLYLDCPLSRVVALLEGGSPLGGAAQVDGAVARVGALVIGLQSVAPGRSALHITVAGAPTEAELTTLTHKAEALRRVAERVEAAA
jgi:nitrite reductase/ring-hydroxylating ferredoxin subunit